MVGECGARSARDGRPVGPAQPAPAGAATPPPKPSLLRRSQRPTKSRRFSRPRLPSPLPATPRPSMRASRCGSSGRCSCVYGCYARSTYQSPGQATDISHDPVGATMGVTTSGPDDGRPEQAGSRLSRERPASCPHQGPQRRRGRPSRAHERREGARSVASIRNRSGTYVRICRVFVAGLANTGQGWGIAPRPRKRSQRSPYDLPGRVQVSLLAAAVVLFAGWQARPAEADAEPATTVVADVATGVAEGAAPSLAAPAATTDTDEVAADGEAPSEAEPHPAPGQEPAEPTSPGVPPASAGATPAPDPESRQPRPTRDAESRQPRPTRDAESRKPRPTRDAESRQPRPTRDAESRQPRPTRDAESRQPRPTRDAESRPPRPTPDAEPRQPRPTPDAEPPQARPAPEVTKEHPAGAADVTTADSPAVAQPTAPSGSELEPTGPPSLEPAGRPAQVDAPDDESAPARPPRARTRTAQDPSLPASHAPAAPRRLVHESAPGAAYPAAPPPRVRKRAARPDRSVTRARGSQSRPAPEAPHRRGVPGAASAAAAAGNGTASPSNAVLSGEADLAPAHLVRPLRLSRPVLRPTSVAEPRERPG